VERTGDDRRAKIGFSPEPTGKLVTKPVTHGPLGLLTKFLTLRLG
jgi:hypothetical protein